MLYWLIPLALLVLVALWLLWELRGNSVRIWPEAPGGALRYRVNYNSLLARLISRLTRGTNGIALHYCVAIHGTVCCAANRVADPTRAPFKAAHEIAGHVLRQRQMGGWAHLWHYVTSKAWAADDEQRADAAARYYQGYAHFQHYAREEAR